MNVNDTAAVAAFLMLGITRKPLRKLMDKYGSPHRAWENFSESKNEDMFIKYLKICEEQSIQGITLHEKAYPVLLKEISSPSLFLFVRGDVRLLSAVHSVAVVGTRNISAYGQQVLYEIIPPLVRAGVTIVSGLAYGVDSLAHQIALEHGGKCIAVLGNGVDIIYPNGHRGLARKILENGGAIVSEQPPGMQPLPQFFPARNRIISGLSKATIVVEAKEKSGSLITAQFALDQNRDVYAVPGNIFNENQQGSNQLISQGAYPLLSAKYLLEQLHMTNGGEVIESIPVFDCPDEKFIYENLKEPKSLDFLVENLSIDVSKIGRILSVMELKGIIRNLPGANYIRI